MRHGDPCDFGCCYWGRLGGGETSGRSGDKDDARAGPPFAPPRLRRSTAFGFRRSSTRSSIWPVAISTSSLPSWNRVTGAFEALGCHLPEPRNGGRSGCFCCSATQEVASASLLKPAYLLGGVPA